MDGTEVKRNFKGDDVEVIGPCFDEGKPEGEEAGKWRHKLESRDDILSYITNGERYWYSTEWFGSERRKSPA